MDGVCKAEGPAAKQKRIPAMLEVLTRTASELESLSDRLMEGLHPVMCPPQPTPQPADGGPPEADHSPTRCEYDNAICNIGRSLDFTAGRLRDILERLEV